MLQLRTAPTKQGFQAPTKQGFQASPHTNYCPLLPPLNSLMAGDPKPAESSHPRQMFPRVKLWGPLIFLFVAIFATPPPPPRPLTFMSRTIGLPVGRSQVHGP